MFHILPSSKSGNVSGVTGVCLTTCILRLAGVGLQVWQTRPTITLTCYGVSLNSLGSTQRCYGVCLTPHILWPAGVGLQVQQTWLTITSTNIQQFCRISSEYTSMNISPLQGKWLYHCERIADAGLSADKLWIPSCVCSWHWNLMNSRQGPEACNKCMSCQFHVLHCLMYLMRHGLFICIIT